MLLESLMRGALTAFRKATLAENSLASSVELQRENALVILRTVSQNLCLPFSIESIFSRQSICK